MAQHPSYADYAYASQPSALFDVRWRHFNPQLSLNAAHQQETAAPSGVSFDHRETVSVPIQPQQPRSQHLLPTNQQYKYLVRIINPGQKSKHVTKIWHDVHKRFQSANQLKCKLIHDFDDKLPPLATLECGYLEKGAKRWIEDDQDMEAMYKAFSCGNEITIWCEGQTEQPPAKNGRKRKAEESEDIPSSKRSDAIDKLALELHEKHGEAYSGPQYRLWARMKINNQHSSLEIPPQIPIFSGSVPKTPKRESLGEALTTAATAVVGLLKGSDASNSVTTCTVTGLSPGKRARVSGEYLEHLQKLKTLQDSGVLTTEEFKEQKGFVLKNIRKLND